MPKKSSRGSYIFKHQYVPRCRHIPSDTLTVPDLVLSMREVYNKYVMYGSVDGLAVSPLVQDDRVMEDLPEEMTDSLLISSRMREDALRQLEEKKPEEVPEEKPEEKPEENSES